MWGTSTHRLVGTMTRRNKTENYVFCLCTHYPSFPMLGQKILRGRNPLGKLSLARNSKSQHSSDCWLHPRFKISVLSVHSTAHSQPPPDALTPSWVMNKHAAFPLLMAFSLPTQVLREQWPPRDTDAGGEVTVTDDRSSVGALNSLPGSLPKTPNGYAMAFNTSLLQKSAGSVLIDKGCPSHIPLENKDTDLWESLKSLA